MMPGPKRATACLLRDVEQGRETMARVMSWCSTEATSRAQSVVRRRWRVKPLNQVDDAFAWDEGEGERTRDDWLAMHKRYFKRRGAAEGFAFDDSLPAAFERFTVVWPIVDADS